MRRIARFLLLAGLLVLAFLPPRLVLAEDENPWQEVFQEDGSLNPGLVDLGVVVEHPDWMSIELPFGQSLDLPANYHRYQTPSGDIVVLPSAATLFFMAMHPQESLLNASQGFIGDGRGSLISFLGSAAGSFIDWDQARSDHPEFADPALFWDAALNDGGEVWTYFSGWSFITRLLQMSWEDGALRSLYLLYTGDEQNCASVPGGCAVPVQVPPARRDCPTPTARVGEPELVIRKIAPRYALVVGQDPDLRRGADIEARALLPPVILTWYEPIYTQVEVCRRAETGEMPTCSTRGVRTSLDGVSQIVTVLAECRAHTARLPERVTGLQASAVLEESSQAWITGQLSQTHYQAYLRQTFYGLVPDLTWWSGGCDASAACRAQALAERVPFRDPGVYRLDLALSTSGTTFQGARITPPRLLTADGALQVWVTLPAMVQ